MTDISHSAPNAAIIDDTVCMRRADLEHEHRWLIARLHRLRALLGYPPLLTGKRRRQEQGESSDKSLP